MNDLDHFEHLVSIDYDAASNASNDSHDAHNKPLHPELRNRLSKIGITNSITDLLNPPKAKLKRRGELDFRSPYEIMREKAAMNKSPDFKKSKTVKIADDPGLKVPGRAMFQRSQTRALRGKGKFFGRAGTVAVGLMDRRRSLSSCSSSSSSSGMSSSEDSGGDRSGKSESIESVEQQN